MTSTSSSRKWVLATWDGSSFRPASEYDQNLLAHIKAGTRMRLDVSEFRSLPRNSYYWVVLQIVIENNELFATKESLHKLLLLACGVTEPLIDVDGEIHMIPASTAFDKMDEEQFKRYFDRAMQVIREKILPGLDQKLLEREADRHSAGTRKPYHPK